LQNTYIDIEINNLEDAYINIAREEEKILEEMHVRRSSMSMNYNPPSTNAADLELINQSELGSNSNNPNTLVSEKDKQDF
jgi:hypothetical protein